MKVRSKGFEHRKRRGQATFEMQVQEQRSLSTDTAVGGSGKVGTKEVLREGLK